VEALDLSFNGLDDTAARLLARAGTLPRLRELRLNDNGRITADGVAALAGSPAMSGLELLDVSANDVGPAGVAAVADSEYLGGLHAFAVHANRIGDPGAAALAASPLLPRMLAREPRLVLPRCGIGPAGARALAAAAGLASARELDLTGNALGDDGVRALAESDHLPNLRRLVLIHNQIRNAGAVALANSPVMAGLDALDVSSNLIGRRGIDALWSARKDFHTVLEYGDNLGGVAPEDLIRELIGDLPLRALLEALPDRRG
jgi:Ran GTPase-activating protein (RanGAP) involved in mRNA processing and transport